MVESPAATRPTPAHLDSLDGWGGMAILLLLIGHFVHPAGLDAGAMGVSAFFVLSGWLMTRLLFVQKVPIGLFFRRRISRIAPAHIVFISLVLGVMLLRAQPVSMAETIAALLFVNNYITRPAQEALMPFGHVWSLAVEEHSCALLALLAVACRMGRLRPLTAVAGVMLLCLGFIGYYGLTQTDGGFRFGKSLHTEVAALGIFTSATLLMVLRARAATGRAGEAPIWAVPVLLLCATACYWWRVPPPLQLAGGMVTLALALNLLPQSPARLQAVFAWRPLRQFGLWSFSLYLWQQPFYLWAHAGGITTLQGLLLALASGLASYYLIEQPVRRWLNANWTSWTPWRRTA